MTMPPTRRTSAANTVASACVRAGPNQQRAEDETVGDAVQRQVPGRRHGPQQPNILAMVPSIRSLKTNSTITNTPQANSPLGKKTAQQHCAQVPIGVTAWRRPGLLIRPRATGSTTVATTEQSLWLSTAGEPPGSVATVCGARRVPPRERQSPGWRTRDVSRAGRFASAAALGPVHRLVGAGDERVSGTPRPRHSSPDARRHGRGSARRR